MPSFININRPDYVNPEQVYIKSEFDELKFLHSFYCRKAISFWIRNNLKKQTVRNKKAASLVLRIFFQDLWEWHIPQEFSSIFDKMKKIFPKKLSKSWDCLWVLKSTLKSNIPTYYCDVVIFLPAQPDEDTFLNSLAGELESFPAVSQIKTFKFLNNSADSLEDLCIPGQNGNILHCEFAHDISVSPDAI